MENCDRTLLITEINRLYPAITFQQIKELLAKHGNNRQAIIQECDSIFNIPNYVSINPKDYATSYPNFFDNQIMMLNNNFSSSGQGQILHSQSPLQKTLSYHERSSGELSRVSSDSLLLHDDTLLDPFSLPFSPFTTDPLNYKLRSPKAEHMIHQQREHLTSLKRRFEILQKDFQENTRLKEIVESLAEQRNHDPDFPRPEETQKLYNLIDHLKQRIEKEKQITMDNNNVLLRHSTSCPPQEQFHQMTPPLQNHHDLFNDKSPAVNTPPKNLDEVWPPLIPAPSSSSSSVNMISFQQIPSSSSTASGHESPAKYNPLFTPPLPTNPTTPSSPWFQPQISSTSSSLQLQQRNYVYGPAAVRYPQGHPGVYNPLAWNMSPQYALDSNQLPVAWNSAIHHPGYPPVAYPPPPTMSSNHINNGNGRPLMGHGRQSSDGQLRWLHQQALLQHPTSTPTTPSSGEIISNQNRFGSPHLPLQQPSHSAALFPVSSLPFTSSASSINLINNANTQAVKCCIKCKQVNSIEQFSCNRCGWPL